MKTFWKRFSLERKSYVNSFFYQHFSGRTASSQAVQPLAAWLGRRWGEGEVCTSTLSSLSGQAILARWALGSTAGERAQLPFSELCRYDGGAEPRPAAAFCLSLLPACRHVAGIGLWRWKLRLYAIERPVPCVPAAKGWSFKYILYKQTFLNLKWEKIILNNQIIYLNLSKMTLNYLSFLKLN